MVQIKTYDRTTYESRHVGHRIKIKIQQTKYILKLDRRPLVTISINAELKPKLENRDCFAVVIILPAPTLARQLVPE
ncbi:MAG TPA: hypothetical protein VFI73_07130 [Candidatus Nitrosopolaris sp.]|nr:hypothetical protein [Candidatus Nitrosopolaris sp.]